MAYIDVKKFGAVGDGKTDDTAALQAAIDESAKTGTPVFLDGGVYMTGRLKMRPHTGLCAEPVWKYRGGQLGAVIKLNDPAVKCHIDLTDAFGASFNGVIFDGGHLGEGIHGLMLDHPEFSKEEETYRFERCKIQYYSGDGVHLNRIWVYSMRFCMVFANKGHGIYTYGWDCFLTDNWLSGNGGAGYYTDQTTDKMIFTANRVEWNKLGGMVYKHGDMLNITGNCFDHNFGPGIMFTADSNIGWENSGITITGNVFERNGAADEHADPYCDSQIYLKNQKGISLVGNVFRTGRDDNQQGRVKPSYGIVYGDMSYSVIANNTMHKGAAKELIVNLGGDTEVVCKDNPGTLWT
ncbi:MAG: right-handed parallel beta-helix repeat-containing protein [Firmicutes bacterium]|nr:right-handed parallel beta-helix repeat-containing protein [Bacillota bacterium]